MSLFYKRYTDYICRSPNEVRSVSRGQWSIKEETYFLFIVLESKKTKVCVSLLFGITVRVTGHPRQCTKYS